MVFFKIIHTIFGEGFYLEKFMALTYHMLCSFEISFYIFLHFVCCELTIYVSRETDTQCKSEMKTRRWLSEAVDRQFLLGLE